MERVKMSKELLNIINAVVDYRRYIISNNYIFPEQNFDSFKQTEEYFKTLPLPQGMKKNRITFQNILA